MKNLDQIRAKSALDFANCGQEIVNTEGGDVVKKLPAMIMAHGLLAAAAFAYQKQQEGKGQDKRKNKDNGFYLCFNAIAKHLALPEIGILKFNNQGGQNEPKLEDLLKFLLDQDSFTLRRATEEAMAWLCYARRFVVKGKGKEDNHREDAHE